MEDPRLSRMYARLFSSLLGRKRRKALEWTQRNRAGLIRVVLLLTVVGFGIGYYAHIHGRFRRLKVELQARHEVAATPMPGGQEAITLARTARGDGAFPEFLSATMLPGRGMSVLQLTALIPGRGEVPLLRSPTLEEATALLTGEDDDAHGQKTLELGGPIEVPWAGALSGPGTPDGDGVLVDWRGRWLPVPRTALRQGVAVSEGGLLLRSAADSLSRDVMPDGGSVVATYKSSGFAAKWPSELLVTTSVLLSGRAFELQVQARNVGGEATPVGIGWMPHFLVLGGDRSQALLRLPAEATEVMRGNSATGQVLAVGNTNLNFTERGGRRLGAAEIDETFVSLRSGFLDNGPTLELRDPQSGIVLRMTALSPQIRAIHVQAPAHENVVGLGFQTNYTDPFRREWSAAENAGMVTLQPGQMVRWRVRLELMTMAQDGVPPL